MKKIYIIKNISYIKWKKDYLYSKMVNKGCLLHESFFLSDEMNELAYDLGVPNRVVQADRAKDPQFAPEED